MSTATLMEIKPPAAKAADMRWSLQFVANLMVMDVVGLLRWVEKGLSKQRLSAERSRCMDRLSVAQLAGALSEQARTFLETIVSGEADAETVRAFRQKYEQP